MEQPMKLDQGTYYLPLMGGFYFFIESILSKMEKLDSRMHSNISYILAVRLTHSKYFGWLKQIIVVMLL
jgi:hypothetical protein